MHHSISSKQNWYFSVQLPNEVLETMGSSCTCVAKQNQNTAADGDVEIKTNARETRVVGLKHKLDLLSLMCI